MHKFLIAAAVTVAATIAASAPGHAQGYVGNRSVCAQQYTSSGLIVRCYYDNFEQCRAFLSGLGGTCSVNPYSRRGS